MRPIPKPTDIHRLRFGTYPALLRRRNGQVVQLVRNGIRQVSLRQLDEIVLSKSFSVSVQPGKNDDTPTEDANEG